MATSLDRAGQPAGLLTGRPFWLKLDPDPLYGVLHTPEAGPRAPIAALILPTFGWENECSYRSRRDWATTLAQAGIATARIDFPGAEDSVGSPLASGRAQSWIDAAGEAANWLRAVSGCERLVAIGIGLGGMVAYQAAAKGAAIDDLILWAVRASGRMYIREQQAFARVASDAPPDERDATRTDVIGLAGHAMSAETVEVISGVNLVALELPDARLRRVMLIGRDESGVDARLRDHLEATDAEVTVFDSDDYRDLMMTPELSVTPTKTIEKSRDWILAASTAGHEAIVHPQRTCVPDVAEEIEFDFGAVRLRERLLEFEVAGARVFGVSTEPVGPRQPFCTVSVNTASLRRTGPSRILVESARRAAADGVPAVRIDLPGLGDSEGHAPMVFERYPEHDAESLATLKSVYDQLQASGISQRFVAIGCCLGGFLALSVTLDDPRSVGMVAINPAFRWGAHQRLAHRRWRDVLRGEADTAPSDGKQAPSGLNAILRQRIWSIRRFAEKCAGAALRNSAVLTRIYSRELLVHVRKTISGLGAAGIPVCLVLSSGGVAAGELSEGKTSRRLSRWPNIRFVRLDTPSHLLHPLWSQEELYNHIHEHLAAVAAFVARTGGDGHAAGHDPSDESQVAVSPQEVTRVI